MSDKSNWKNKNRNILKDVGKGVVEGIKNYKLVRKKDMFTPETLNKAKKIVEGIKSGVKKIAKPFIKESIYIDKIIKSKKKKKD